MASDSCRSVLRLVQRDSLSNIPPKVVRNGCVLGNLLTNSWDRFRMDDAFDNGGER